MSPARFIPVTHSAAEIADSVQRENAAAAGASYEREQNDRAQADRWREIDSAATRRFAARGAVGVSTEGQVTQTFACHCGKHSHGHGTPDHSDGFAKIKQPTRFESPEPEWSKRVRTDAGREEARALAKRVDAARAPLTPPPVPPPSHSQPPGGPSKSESPFERTRADEHPLPRRTR